MLREILPLHLMENSQRISDLVDTIDSILSDIKATIEDVSELNDITGVTRSDGTVDTSLRERLVELLGLKLKLGLTGDLEEDDVLRWLRNFYEVLEVKGTEDSFKKTSFFIKLYKDISIHPLWSSDYVDFEFSPGGSTVDAGGDWYMTPHFKVLVAYTVYQELGGGTGIEDMNAGRRIWSEILSHLYDVKPAHTVMSWTIFVGIYEYDDGVTKRKLKIDTTVGGTYAVILQPTASADVPVLTHKGLLSLNNIDGPYNAGDRGIWSFDTTGIGSKLYGDDAAGDTSPFYLRPSIELSSTKVVFGAYETVLFATRSGGSWSFSKAGWNTDATTLNNMIPTLFVEGNSGRIFSVWRGNGGGGYNTYIAYTDDDFATTVVGTQQYISNIGMHRPTIAVNGDNAVFCISTLGTCHRTTDNGASWSVVLSAAFDVSPTETQAVVYWNGAFYMTARCNVSGTDRLCMYKSTDNGASWTRVSILTDCAMTENRVGILDFNDQLLVVMQDTTPDVRLYEYKSDDTWVLGETWGNSQLWRSASYEIPFIQSALGKVWIGVLNNGTSQYEVYYADDYDKTFTAWDTNTTMLDGLISILE